MELGLTVFAVVLVVTIALALTGYRSTEAPRVTSAVRVVSDGISGLARITVLRRMGPRIS